MRPTKPITRRELMQACRYALDNKEKFNLLVIYCSPKTKPKLLDLLWSEDFEYIGTKINIVIDREFNDEPTSMPGAEGMKVTFYIAVDEENKVWYEYAL